MQSPATAPDARIQRFQVKTITITTNPAMPVMADGVFLGEGSVTVMLHPHRLRVMAGLAEVTTTPTSAAVTEETPPAPAAVAQETV